jgi:hypothetical protein
MKGIPLYLGQYKYSVVNELARFDIFTMSRPSVRNVIGCERLSGCIPLWAIPVSIILQNRII